MYYDFNIKRINNSIELTKLEWEIFEELIKFDGHPILLKKLTDIIFEKYCVTKINAQDTCESSIRTYIYRLNKKTNRVIKCKRGFGYYIEEEIKFG